MCGANASVSVLNEDLNHTSGTSSYPVWKTKKNRSNHSGSIIWSQIGYFKHGWHMNMKWNLLDEEQTWLMYSTASKEQPLCSTYVRTQWRSLYVHFYFDIFTLSLYLFDIFYFNHFVRFVPSRFTFAFIHFTFNVALLNDFLSLLRLCSHHASLSLPLRLRFRFHSIPI